MENHWKILALKYNFTCVNNCGMALKGQCDEVFDPILGQTTFPGYTVASTRYCILNIAVEYLRAKNLATPF